MRLERVLLVNPPLSLEQVYGKYAAGAPVLPPLGFCYIASVLLERGFEVRLLDCAAEGGDLASVERAIREFKPQLLGVTSTTVSFHCAGRVIALAKSVDPEIVTVLGGAHVSAVPRETLEELAALDFGVYGEGERTIEQLCRALAEGLPLEPILGLAYRGGGEVRLNPPRPNEPDLDRFRIPARHLLKDLRRYSPNPLRGFSRSVSLISSRGCTFDCSYCDQSVFSRRWRGHSAGHVIEEIKALKREWGFDFFSFEDDHFLINHVRAIELCRRMIDEKLDIGWTCSARANSFTPELAALMKEAGCKIVFLGLESGSPRILRQIDKDIDLAAAARGVELIAAAGIRTYGAFMIGTPGETAADARLSIEFALSLPLDAVSCFVYVPYPGTPLRELALRSGFVSDDWRDYSAHPTRLPFLNAGDTEEGVLGLQREFYRRFYLRPSHIFRHLPHYLNRAFLPKAAVMLRDFTLNQLGFRRKAPARPFAHAGAVAGQRARAHT